MVTRTRNGDKLTIYHWDTDEIVEMAIIRRSDIGLGWWERDNIIFWLPD